MTKFDFELLRIGDLVTMNHGPDKDKQCIVCYVDTLNDYVLIRSMDSTKFTSSKKRLNLVSKRSISVVP